MRQLENAKREFSKNTKTVLSLSDLDRGLLDQVISAVERRDARLKAAKIDSYRLLAGSTLENLRNVRENDSLRPGFQALVNQSVVLLASYFASGISTLFQAGIEESLRANSASEHLQNLQLKLTVQDLAGIEEDLPHAIPQLIVESPGISFQDTKSIARTVDNFFNVKIPRDRVTCDVAAGLAFRHVLVHNGGRVDRPCIRQLEAAKPRSLKDDVELGQELVFGTEEVALLAGAMVEYVSRLADDIAERLRSGPAGAE